jgi:hypothetical protein
MKKNILSILVAAFALPVLSHAQITNPGFELGTTGWANSTGDSILFYTTSSLSSPGWTTVNPTAGSQFGVLSDYGVNLFDGVDTETVSQTFTINSAGILSLNYRFLTDAANVPAYNPSTQITLTTGGGPITLASISSNDLQADPADSGPLSPGAAYQVGNGLAIGQDAWQTASFDVSSLVGQSVTLAFNISEDSFPNDSSLNSELAIDNVSISPVPEPTTGALLAGGFGLVTLLKLRRKSS